MSNEVITVVKHFEAELSLEELLEMRVQIAKSGLTSKKWLAEAIVEKLNKEKE